MRRLPMRNLRGIDARLILVNNYPSGQKANILLEKAMNVFFKGSALAALLLSSISVAHADVTLGVTYYTVIGLPQGGSQDFDTNPCCSSYYTNEVQSTLGPGGLPVYNASYGGPTLYNVNGNGELTWWSPSQNSAVTQTGTGTVTLPFANYSFFPPNGTNTNNGDANGFQAAVFSGTLHVPSTEAVTFSFGADDDAFLYLNGTIVSQEGGIHGVSAAPVTTSTLAPGDYLLQLFYTDRHQTGAGIYFDVTTADVTGDPVTPGVPEPSTWAMMILGFFGVGFMAYRRRNNNAMLTAA
jgi:fibro-slime domain-containing protein